MKGSELVVGYPSGLTIMSVALKVKTLIIWNKYYNRDFWSNGFPPDTKNKTYFMEDTLGLTATKLVERVVQLVTGEDKTVVLPKHREISKISRVDEAPTVQIEKKEIQEIDITSPNLPLPILNGARTAVVCVLKKGGSFDIGYVQKLKGMVERNTTAPFDFVCFTDSEDVKTICKTIPLKHAWVSWWSKIELFRPNVLDSKHVVYFDLDTIIVGNIDQLLRTDFTFGALCPWNPRNRKNGMFASGMLAWQNKTHEFIYQDFTEEDIPANPRGDQQYMSRKLAEYTKQYQPIQDCIDGVYSFKRDCRRELPHNAKIICFHGKPRPSEVRRDWVTEHWRA